MNRRQSKKVLNLRFERWYTDQQVYSAALRIARYCRAGGDEEGEIDAIRSIPYEHIQVDGALDLRVEGLEGKPVIPVLPDAPRTPVYRKDGQIHNFNAIGVEEPKHHLTRKRYDAYFGAARPVPKHNVGKLQG